MARAYGYTRVSTDMQVQEGVSLDAQRERLAAWCSFQGHTLAEVFVDAGISGADFERPGLKALSDAAKKGDVVVFYSISRIGRSTIETLQLLRELEKRGVLAVSLTEQFDASTAAGKMMVGQMALFAEFERNVIAERVKTALSHKRSNGQIYSAPPFGMQRGADKALVPHPDEMPVLVEMLERHEAGQSLRQIVSWLLEIGVPTKSGGKWCAATVRYILNRAKSAPALYRTTSSYTPEPPKNSSNDDFLAQDMLMQNEKITDPEIAATGSQ